MLVLNILLLVDTIGLRANALHELICLFVQNLCIGQDSDVTLITSKSSNSSLTWVLLIIKYFYVF